ncbi:MAG TPA: EAL domain-containing protein [Baekduia sp.]|nr:EAL domain-containing protein [Baekduia sp.]
MSMHNVATVAVHTGNGPLADRLRLMLGHLPDLRLVDAAQPRDVTLIDAHMDDATVLARRLTEAGGTFLVIFDGSELDQVTALLDRGAMGCVSARSDAQALRTAIGAARRGTVTMPASVAHNLRSRAAAPGDTGAGQPLVERRVVARVIAEQRFEIMGQPIVHLRSGEVVAVKTLPRFSVEPVLPPSTWLAAAEQHGMRVELEHRLLEAALAQLPGIPQHVVLSVRLSPEAAMAPALEGLLDGAPLHRLILEIADHRTLDDYEPLSEALSRLRTGGMRIAVDDSGAGLSSLLQVAQLAPDHMKLNRALTRNIDQKPMKHSLACTLTSFASQVDASVVVEGLETEAELVTLRALGATLGYGYLLAHPRPIPELDLTSPVPVPADDATGQAAGTPAVDVRGVLRQDFHEAMRVALRMLSRQHPSATFAVAHLDYVRRRHTILASHGPLAALLEPGAFTDVEDTMAFHMAAGRGPSVCPNVNDDLLYGGLPQARGLEAGSYVGVPLELPDETRMGALYGIDRRPGGFTPDDVGLLAACSGALGTVLMEQVSGDDHGEVLRYLRELARTDSVTGALNEPGFTEMLEEELDRPPGRRLGAFVAVEVDDLESLRRHYGRAVADLSMKDLAGALRASADRLDPVGRLDDDRFGVLLLRERPEESVPRLLSGLESRMADSMARREITMSIRAGAVPLKDVPSLAEAWPRAAAEASPVGRRQGREARPLAPA